MASLPKVSIFAIACLVLGVAKAEVKTALEEHLNYSMEQLFFSSENLNANNHQLVGLPYALCKNVKEATSSRFTEMRCKIVVHSKTPSEKYCDISLKAAPSSTTTHSRIGNLIKLIKFGSQKAVLLWFEESIDPSFGIFKGKIRSSIVDLTTCQSKEVVLLEVNIDSSNTVAYANIIPYEDSFDVIIGFPTSEWYKFGIDSEGKITENKQGWAKSGQWISQFTSAALYSRSKGYLRFNEEFAFRTKSNLKNEVFLIKPDGSQKQLGDQTIATMKSVSTVHQTISIAFVVDDKTVKIQKFDQEGNSKLNFSVNFNYTIANLQIHNLAGGGFLLLTTSKDKPYYVAKLDASGKRIGQLELTTGFKKDHGVMSYLYSETVALEDNPSGGYCLSSVYSPTIKGQLREESDLDLLVKCFSDSDFSTKPLNDEDKPYSVTKFSASGRYIGQLELTTGPKKDPSDMSHLYSETVALEDNPLGGYCLSSVHSPSSIHVYDLRKESNLDLVVKCFSDSYLLLQCVTVLSQFLLDHYC